MGTITEQKAQRMPDGPAPRPADNPAQRLPGDSAQQPDADQPGLDITDTALVFEGGGMRASLTSAFALELLRRRIRFDWVAGISAGASNAVNYISNDERRTRRSFVEFSADPNFGDWRTFTRGQGLFNAHYIYQESGGQDQALPFDWRSFTASPADVRVVGFNMETGEQTTWSKADCTTMEDLMVRVRASSTMPVLMPPTPIDGQLYVDGAMGATGGFPLDVAMDEGFEKFCIVLTQPRDYVKKPMRLTHLLRTYFRKYPALVDAMLTRHQRYNETREQIFELERQGKAYVFAPQTMPVRNSTRDMARLAAAQRLGASQARSEFPALREFLNLPKR